MGNHSLLLFLLFATIGLAQETTQLQNTFGNRVVSSTGFPGHVYLLNDKTHKLPQGT